MVMTFAVGKGGQAALAREMERAGNYFVVPVKGFTPENIAPHEFLTLQDAEAIARNLPEAFRVVPVNLDINYARSQDRELEVTLLGTTSDYFKMRQNQLREARYFDDKEASRGGYVAVLHYEAAEEFIGVDLPWDRK